METLDDKFYALGDDELLDRLLKFWNNGRGGGRGRGGERGGGGGEEGGGGGRGGGRGGGPPNTAMDQTLRRAALASLPALVIARRLPD